MVRQFLALLPCPQGRFFQASFFLLTCMSSLSVLSAEPVVEGAPAVVTENSDKSGKSEKSDKPKKSNAIRTEKVEVRSKRIRVITPLPGLAIDRALATTNIQSATGKQLQESRSTSLTEFMNAEMQSVSLNDYAGNPFQQDLNFRGFSASPAIGTPQGISVYMDGVRVNEPFGEVVNWDLIPMNAIASIDLIPGANPLFGLNTIGGALAIRTKTGFTDRRARGQILTGAWGRQQVQVSNGMNNGMFGLFTAYNDFKEDGWRQNSPSEVRQLYNNATMKFSAGEINLSALNVETKLTGNGLLPSETAELDRTAVFTSPDESSNKLEHYNLNGRLDITDKLSISMMAYKRRVHQKAIGGDLNERYQATLSALGGPYTAILPPGANPDGDGDGFPDNCYANVSLIECPDASKLNGIMNLSDLNQQSRGSTLQMTLALDKHQMAAGYTFDANSIKFLQSQQLAEIDENHVVSVGTNPLYGPDGWNFITAVNPVIRADLKGSSRTESIFFSDTWSPMDTLHVTYGARINWTNVQNTLIADRGLDLYNFNVNTFAANRQHCRTFTGDAFDRRARFVCTEGDFGYRSFTPAAGVSWELRPDITLYGNWSRGARAPSVIELGCARDYTKSDEPASTNFQYGCAIPTALSADPYLRQVRSVATEGGVRWNAYGFDWNAGWFRTELTDDILFVPLGRKNRGVFDNFGKTLRRGIEMGARGEIGRSKLRFNYTYMRATFETPAQLINEANSTNTAVTTNQAFVNIQPDDEIPGLPNHIFQASWNFRFSERFDSTLSVVAHSSAFVRGNENNDHNPRDASGTIRDPYDYIGAGRTPGYSVFNLRANYRLDHGLTLFAKVDNLFDTDYATAGDLGRNGFNAAGTFLTDTRQWSNTTFIGPAAPRAMWVGLSVDLDWQKRQTD